MHEKLTKFINENQQFISQPIVKSFLNDSQNYELFKLAICEPTKSNKEKLDEEFKKHYTNARIIKYVSMLIHFSAIEYDKKLRNNQKRYPLTLDRPINSDEDNITLLDTISTNDYDPLEAIEKNSDLLALTDYFSCRYLIAAINSLKPKQKLILKYKYVDNLKNIEIAEIFNDSPQNISKINKKTLKKIKEYIEKGKGKNGQT